MVPVNRTLWAPASAESPLCSTCYGIFLLLCLHSATPKPVTRGVWPRRLPGLDSMHAQSPSLFTSLVSLLRRHQRRLNAMKDSIRNVHGWFSFSRLTIFWSTLAAIVITGCADSKEALINEKTPVEPAPRPALIATLAKPSDRILHEFIGKVDAAQTVDLSFEVSGQLASITPREGDRLAAGSLIAALDPTPFEISVREAKAQFELAELDLRRARAVERQSHFSSPGRSSECST